MSGDPASSAAIGEPEPHLFNNGEPIPLSPLEKCFMLLDMPPLGDRHPLALYEEMRALFPQDINIFYNAIFLRGLPEAMRATLAVQHGHSPLHELAAAASLLHYISRSGTAGAATSATATAAVPQGPPSGPHSGSPSSRHRQSVVINLPQASSHRRHRQHQLPQSSSSFCFYHCKFGRSARHCQPPCSWPSSE
jgi:hypothetical protein